MRSCAVEYRLGGYRGTKRYTRLRTLCFPIPVQVLRVMYFSTVVLASAALCGVTICATPLPSTNESYNVDLGSVLKRQSADCICGGTPGSSLSMLE
jgi:hypothetical protein